MKDKQHYRLYDMEMTTERPAVTLIPLNGRNSKFWSIHREIYLNKFDNLPSAIVAIWVIFFFLHTDTQPAKNAHKYVLSSNTMKMRMRKEFCSALMMGANVSYTKRKFQVLGWSERLSREKTVIVSI